MRAVTAMPEIPTATIRGIRTLWNFATGGTSHLSTLTTNPCPWSSSSRWCGASLTSRLSVAAVAVGCQTVKKETSEQGAQIPPPGWDQCSTTGQERTSTLRILDFPLGVVGL